MMKDMKNELHKLLDKMLDEKQPIGVLQKATNVDGRLIFDKYELILRKKEGYYGYMDN